MTALDKSKKDMKYHKYFLKREAAEKAEKDKVKKQEMDKQQKAHGVAIQGGEARAGDPARTRNPGRKHSKSRNFQIGKC